MNNKQTYILLIFEGAKTEPKITNNLEKYFLNERKHLLVKAVYGTTIYKLYKEFLSNGEFDDDLDTFSLAQELNEELEEIEREQVAEIHLFFDYDKHASNANDDDLQNMLSRFNNETEKGKLYISYPMVEALKHLNSKDDFQYLKSKCNKNYKARVDRECENRFKHFNCYDEATWFYAINQHAMKANYLVNGSYTFPLNLIEQMEVFKKQLKAYQEDEQVQVLSAFPMFLLDYYGVDKISNKLNLYDL